MSVEQSIKIKIMKKTFILLSIVFISISMYGQRLSPQVIVSSGSCFKASSGVSLSFSLGECVTETYSNSSVILSQGFQQGYYEVKPLAIYDGSAVDMQVYPLPATDYITIGLGGDKDKCFAEIYDINGKLVLTKQLVQESTNLNLEEMVAGTYILVVTDNTKKALKTMQIIKN
jgi:hypothetical protein